MCEYRYNGNVRFITMPKLSYQEIVTADVSESGTVMHEWILEGEGNFVSLSHYIDSTFVHTLRYGDAIKKWNELCRSKK